MSQLCLPPLSLYIHIPWCERKCPYCDFNSHEADGALPESAYIDALLRDLQAELPLAQGRALQSIFIGGGTPSLLSAQSVNDLLCGVRQCIALDDDCEVTIEANPGSAEAERFAGFVSAGINRLSLGIQSFDDAALRHLGRVHTAEQALAAIPMAREAGFHNLNLDLMHGLPGQEAAEAASDIDLAIGFKPEHLSWYELTIERNTTFWKRPPVLPVESELAAIQEVGEQRLESAGYRNYEVSAYARDSYTSRHNLNYWQFGDYLGIGAGAHGKITREDQQDILRTAKKRQPSDYLAPGTTVLASRESVAPGDRVGQYMLNALRLNDGFAADEFEQRTGVALASIEAALNKLVDLDLLCHTAGRVRTTALGRRYLDSVVAEFV